MPELAAREATGAAIRAARLDAGLTLRELAAEVGVSAGTMSAIENGKVGLAVDRLHRIAEIVAVSPTDLLSPPPASAPEEQRRIAGTVASPDPAGWRRFDPLDLDPVLNSALEVFHETGYHGATMRLIAAGADISVAGIYHHYPSKKHLLVELVTRAHADLRWRLDAARAEHPENPEDAFAAMVEALVLFRERRRSLAFVMVTEAARAEIPVDADPGPDGTGVREQLASAARDALHDQSFSKTEPELVVTAVLTLCLAPANWIPGADSHDADVVADAYSRFARSLL